MSNKIVPLIYRSVIDDVMANIKPEFDEYGVSEDVLAELQAKWEAKVIASNVADFEPGHASIAPAAQSVAAAAAGGYASSGAPGGPTPFRMLPHTDPHEYTRTSAAQAYSQPPPPVLAGPPIKTEPVDPRYVLTAPGMSHYTLPTLPGPQIGGARPGLSLPGANGTPARGPQLSFPSSTPPVSARSSQSQVTATPPPGSQTSSVSSATASPAARAAIPQVDGPSSSSGGSPSPPPLPRAAHPSLPQPSPAGSGATQEEDDAEAINSDLDDSDTENDEEAGEPGPGTDMIFCTYDKVARVKNKWKCVLKDGMIHVNNKDYLFAKCTGEFEW